MASGYESVVYVPKFSTIPASARRSSPALGVSPGALISALVMIENQTPERASGALIFYDEQHERGVVFLEEGRICWAVAGDMHRRLTDLICSQTQPPLDPGTLELTYAKCRAENTPLGEALVDGGVVTERGLRNALCQHSTEAIALLHRSNTTRVVFKSHTQQRYQARFTFSTSDLLVSFAGLVRPEAASRAKRRLRGVADHSAAGLAFLRDDSASLVVAGHQIEDMGVAGVTELTSWAAQTLDLSEAVDPDRKLVAAALDNRMSAVAWLENDLVYALVAHDATSLARILSKARTAAE